jgi:hypothetical protein
VIYLQLTGFILALILHTSVYVWVGRRMTAQLEGWFFKIILVMFFIETWMRGVSQLIYLIFFGEWI